MILVTGGMGYIGSHTVVELMNNGFDVLIVDDLSNSDISILDGIEKITGKRPKFINMDVCMPEFFRMVEEDDNINAIIHFAAFKSVNESIKNPTIYYENNLISLFNVIEACRSFDMPLVFSSSCTVYGQPEKLPVTEKSPILPAESPYGNTKQIAEEIISDTVKASKNLNVISLRYFNPIGAHPTALIGELPIGTPSNLVPYITQTAVGIRKQLQVFGDDYDTSDGTPIRDYINVVDLAKAHVISIKRLLTNNNKRNYEVFNLGTGKGNTVLEIIKTFEKVSNTKLKYKIVGRRPGDIEKIYADVSLANEELEWKCESSLEDSLLSAWKWQQNLNNE